MESFGIMVNPLKCAVLSVGGVSRKTGGRAISVVDDTSVAFWGSTEREFRGRARRWLEGAIPLKCAVLSVGGVSGKTVFPSRADWRIAPVKAGGTRLPLLTPEEWDGESGAIKTIRYLGRDLRVG